MTLNEFCRAGRMMVAAFAFVAIYSGLPPAAVGQEAAPMSCVAQGRDYRIGDVACIPACHGSQRLAKCEQTNTGGVAWTSISDSCPQAMRAPLPQMSVGVLANLDMSPVTDLPKLQ